MRYLLYTSILLVSFLLFSCGDKNEEPCIAEEMCHLQKIDNDSIYIILKKENNILLKQLKNRKIPYAKNYHDLTAEYLLYIEKLEKNIESSGENPFFENNELTAEGKSYKTLTNNYYNNIVKLVKDPLVLQKIDRLISTKDFKRGEMYILHMDYYYNGFTKIPLLSSLANKKKNILQLENEFIIKQMLQ